MFSSSFPARNGLLKGILYGIAAPAKLFLNRGHSKNTPAAHRQWRNSLH
jgi:hypothetical protein